MNKKKTLVDDFNEKTYSVKMPVDGSHKYRIAFILKHIPDNHLKILDLGCWDGSYAVRYKKKTNTVYGVESSITATKKSNEKGVITRQGDFMEKTFFPGIKFDIIVAGEIIEHVFDTDEFIRKIKKMLKPKGTLIITTPNVASLPRRILLLLGINPMLENRVVLGISVGHIRYFTFPEMHTLLEDHKFTIIDSKSDIVNFNNTGNFYSHLIPTLYKNIGRTIMICAENSK